MAKCQKPNCKAWAVKNNQFCYSHSADRKKGGAPARNQNARKHGYYSQFLAPPDKLILKEAGRAELEGLDEEIALIIIGIGNLAALGDWERVAALATKKANILAVRARLNAQGETALEAELNHLLEEVAYPRGIDLGRGDTLTPIGEEEESEPL